MFCNAKKDTLSIFKMRHLQASHSKSWQLKLKMKLENNSRHLWRIAFKDSIDDEYQKRIKIYNSPSNPICCSKLSYFITKIGHCVHCSVTSHKIQNHKENVRCAHSEGQDPTGSDQPSRLCLNLNQPQPQPVQLSRLGLNRPQPALLVQPGPQPVQLVEVEAVK